MSLHQARQDFIGPLFQPTNNVGDAVFLTMEQLNGAGKFAKDPLLLTYKGPHASDRQEPHDIQVRVHRNTGSRKAKEPVSVAGPRWVENHPGIYALFCKFTLEAIEKGMKLGAKAVAERVRWETPATGEKPYKVANISVTYMAIKFAEEHPEHAAFFKTHKRK